MFDTEIKNAIAKIARDMDVPVAALLAVAEVESGGRALASVRGRDEPLIRFEGHYFDRFLKGDARLEARAEGLADPRAGAVRNPKAQVARWTLLHRAIRINRTAALSSTSWGVGQVMGAHWQWLGYGSADALVSEARSGVAGQVAVMARYIDKAGLCAALRAGDWAAFARTYNGPAYAKNKYDTKMAAAFARFSVELGEALPKIRKPQEVVAVDGSLRFGDRGAGVAKLQKALTGKGYVLVADGLFGLTTDRIVRRFQRDHLISETGIVGGRERALLFGAVEALVGKAGGKSKQVQRELVRNGRKAGTRVSRWMRSLRRRLQKGVLSIS